jgi:predicted enzyme related to lactoylglutathione lyase
MDQDAINVQGIYAAGTVADFDAGLDWYTRLMGRPADDLPFPGMAQWRNMNRAGLQLWQDKDRAGRGLMTIVVTDIEREKTRLAAAGIELGAIAWGAFGAAAELRDPEGNRINLTEPPKGFVAG